MENKEVTMSNQPRWYAVFTGWNAYRVFEVYEEAWQFAEEVYARTGNVVAIETVN
jgi:hypothetical protein